jgi:hypothetical protein
LLVEKRRRSLANGVAHRLPAEVETRIAGFLPLFVSGDIYQTILPWSDAEEEHMLHTIVCLGCEQVLDQASNAVRRHANLMNTAFDCVRKGKAAEEQVSDFRGRLVESFNEAQWAWDTYREHLAEHGLLPPARHSAKSQR